MNFCIENMTNEEMNLLANQSMLATPVFREATLVFGGVRHQSAAYYGVQPQIGEECHLERRWGRGSDRHEENYAGTKGAVHLINEDGLSYGTLLSGERKILQLKMLGVKNIQLPNDVKNNSNYFAVKYIITDLVKDLDTIHFVSVKAEVI